MASSSPSAEDISQDVVLQRITKAEEYKAQGNELYKAKDIRGAIGQYHRAMLYVRDLDSNLQNILQYLANSGDGRGLTGEAGSSTVVNIPEDLQKRIADVRQGCLNNLAACILLKDAPDYEKVVLYCNSVLSKNPENAKALYRKGCALYHLGDHEEAYDCLKNAQQISRSDPNITKYLTMAKDKMSDVKNAQRLMYQGMFNKTSTQSDG